MTVKNFLGKSSIFSFRSVLVHLRAEVALPDALIHIF